MEKITAAVLRALIAGAIRKGKSRKTPAKKMADRLTSAVKKTALETVVETVFGLTPEKEQE